MNLIRKYAGNTCKHCKAHPVGDGYWQVLMDANGLTNAHKLSVSMSNASLVAIVLTQNVYTVRKWQAGKQWNSRVA